MKKLTSLLALCLLVVIAKSQTPNLRMLIKLVNTPVADVTQEVISMNGWELTKSGVADSVVTLQFDYKDASLLIKKIKDFKNEVFLVCNKLKYDDLNKSLLQLKPKLIDSKVNEKGHIVKTYLGEKYGYKISIAPKSVFVVQVYDKANSLGTEMFESPLGGRSSTGEERIPDSNATVTPLVLSSFDKLIMPQDNGEKTGKVAVRIKVDQHGNVIDATPGVKGTTLNDRDLWEKCEDAVRKAKMTPSGSSPSIRVGIVVFGFRVK
jgi:hypothetical protein